MAQNTAAADPNAQRKPAKRLRMKVLTGGKAETIAHVIHDGYHNAHRALASGRQKKRAKGICSAGDYSCMNPIDPKEPFFSCKPCRDRAAVLRKAAVKRKEDGVERRPLSEYAKMWRRLAAES